jgi:hypothetical protein
MWAVVSFVQPRPTRLLSSQGWVDIGNDSSFVAGAGVPTVAQGASGAIYLDTVAGRLYGPKAAGVWPGSALAVGAGYYNNAATHGAGTTITIPQATHGLRASRGIVVQVQDNSSGAVEFPDVVVAASGDVTVTFASPVSANTKLVTLVA